MHKPVSALTWEWFKLCQLRSVLTRIDLQQGQQCSIFNHRSSTLTWLLKNRILTLQHVAQYTYMRARALPTEVAWPTLAHAYYIPDSKVKLIWWCSTKIILLNYQLESQRTKIFTKCCISWKAAPPATKWIQSDDIWPMYNLTKSKYKCL